MICEPVVTADTWAETAPASVKRPTIIRSTAPYMACRKSAARTGRANLTSGSRICPSVNVMTCACPLLSISDPSSISVSLCSVTIFRLPSVCPVPPQS